MQERLAHILFDEGLVKKTDRLLCAVSGGADSMVMCYLLHNIGLKIVVAHCNFQLRDDESEEDEAFVRHYCKSNNIPFVTKRFETRAYAKQHKLTIQEAAREIRYKWFETQRSVLKCDWICTAHNLSDNAETILINQLRGTGISGLTGIPPQRGHILRPMLFFSGPEIRSFANDHKIPFRNDSSNATDAYLRNSIRHHVTPELAKISPKFENTFAENAGRIQEVDSLLQAFINGFIQEHVVMKNNRTLIPKKALNTFPHPHLILSTIVSEARFDMDQLKQLLNTNKVGKRIENETHVLHFDREHFIFKLKTDKPSAIHISQPGGYTFGTFKITITYVPKDDVSIPLASNQIVLVKEVLIAGISVRTWEQTDRIQPFGMRGNKLVSDVFIDNKVPNASKVNVPIFTSQNDIIWVGGLCFSEVFRVSLDSLESDNEVAHITLKPLQ